MFLCGLNPKEREETTGAMSFASKENSVDYPLFPRRLKSDQYAKEPKAPQGPRVVLGAKPINTDSQVSTGSPVKRSGRKRINSQANNLPQLDRLKKPRLFEPHISNDNLNNEVINEEDEQTDEDEEQHQSLNNHTSTPLSNAQAQRSMSRYKALYPRLKPADMMNLEVDVPATDNCTPIRDNGDEILEGIDLERRPQFGPPRFIPSFFEEVNRNMELDLSDFPDLDSDDGSDSHSTIELRTPTSELKKR